MSKAAIVERVRDQFDTKTAAAAAVDYIATAIVQELVAEGKVTLPGVGTFQRKLQPERNGRNPRNGETIRIAEREVVKFKSHIKL